MVAIGVTGHRVLAESDKIVRGVDEALLQIEKAFPEPPLAVISSLAEAADRLVVHRVLRRQQARLVVPLPLPQPDYMTDFQSHESKEEFLRLVAKADRVIVMPPTATRDEAYAAAGSYVLDHCDVLVAVWDGQAPRGPGGTSDIVAQARQRGLPLAWIHAGNRDADTLEPTTLGEERGTVTFERLPAQRWGAAGP
jgi:hypothetical protein